VTEDRQTDDNDDKGSAQKLNHVRSVQFSYIALYAPLWTPIALFSLYSLRRPPKRHNQGDL